MHQTFAVLHRPGIHSPAPESRTEEVLPFVGKDAEALSKMSEGEINAFILDCAERMVAAHHRYEAHGNFADAGERDYFWHQETAALRERGSRPAVREARG
jgi:hypothetical protein